MAVYYIMLIGLTAIGIALRDRKFAKPYLAVVFFTLFIIAAIRRTSGYDYNLYAQWYNSLVLNDYDWIMAWSREKGFAVPLKILTVISAHYQSMFVLIALVIAVGVCLYIHKFSSRAYISVAAFISLGLFYNSLNFMRQFIAAVIISFAVSYINTKQPLRFFVLVFFASCFHFSALLLIPFYFILRIKMGYAVLGVYTAAAAVSFIFSEAAAGFVTNYFYTAYDPMTSVHMLTGVPVSFCVIFALLFAAFFIFRKELIDKRPLNSILINMSFFAAYFEFIGIKHSIISRFALLFYIAPTLALIPDLFAVVMDRINAKSSDDTPDARALKKMYKAAAAVGFCIFGLIVNAYFLSINYNGVVPYQTIYGAEADIGGRETGFAPVPDE